MIVNKVIYLSGMADNSGEGKPKTAKQLEKERLKKEKAAKFAEKQAKLAAAAANNKVARVFVCVCVTSLVYIRVRFCRMERVQRTRRRLEASK